MLVLPNDKDMAVFDEDDIGEAMQFQEYVYERAGRISMESKTEIRFKVDPDTGNEVFDGIETTGETDMRKKTFFLMDSAISGYTSKNVVWPLLLDPHFSMEYSPGDGGSGAPVRVDFDYFKMAQDCWTNGSSGAPMVWDALSVLSYEVEDAKLSKNLLWLILSAIVIAVSGPLLYQAAEYGLNLLFSSLEFTTAYFVMLATGAISILFLLYKYLSIPISVIYLIVRLKRYRGIREELSSSLEQFKERALKMHRYIRFRVRWFEYWHPGERTPNYLLEMSAELKRCVDRMNNLYGRRL